MLEVFLIIDKLVHLSMAGLMRTTLLVPWSGVSKILGCLSIHLYLSKHLFLTFKHNSLLKQNPFGSYEATDGQVIPL